MDNRLAYGMCIIVSLIIFNQIYKMFDFSKVIKSFLNTKELTLRMLLFIIVVAVTIYVLIDTLLHNSGIYGYRDMLSGICVGWMFSTAGNLKNAKEKK